MVRTVIVANMACVSTDLDCALSYALQRLATPNLILKPEQRSVIESICNGKDTFGYRPGLGSQYATRPFRLFLIKCNAVLAVQRGLTQKADRHCATYVQTSCRGAVRM